VPITVSGVTAGVSPSQSITARVLVGRDFEVRYLAAQDVEAAPADLVTVLDKLLLSQPLDEPAPRLRQV
jgi:hypothetical protein